MLLLHLLVFGSIVQFLTLQQVVCCFKVRQVGGTDEMDYIAASNYNV